MLNENALPPPGFGPTIGGMNWPAAAMIDPRLVVMAESTQRTTEVLPAGATSWLRECSVVVR